MKKNNFIYIRQILDYITYIEDFTKNIDKVDFQDTLEKQFAVIRCFEVIGEAATKIDPSFREKYPQINWKEIIGFRNVLIHNYEGISLDLVWMTTIIEMPRLKLQLLQILEDEA